ncbi:MAG: T9SS type A sorting domain-containing protein [bacterium]|jgi:hypothetical protein|nr:T9SS type A sorting domain-containing protein [bacterium]
MKVQTEIKFVPTLLMFILLFNINFLPAQPIKLAWTPNGNPNVSHYGIYRADQIDSGFKLISTITHPESTYIDEKVLNGSHYYYVATSIDKQGNESGFSNMIDTMLIATPVSSTIFSVHKSDNHAILEWSVVSTINNFDFEVQRSDDNISSFRTIGFVAGKNPVSNDRAFKFVDKDLNKGRYYYRLKQIDDQGSYKYSEVLEVQIDLPQQFTLYQNFPNPFNSSTTIAYYLPQSSHVEVIIYNMNGQFVNRLIDEFQEKGQKSITWDGSDQERNMAPSGIYYYKIIVLDHTEYRRMVLIK